MTARFLGIATFALGAAVSSSARAQVPIAITLKVPVEVKDINPKVSEIVVRCTAQPVGAAAVIFDPNNFATVRPVVDGAFTGTAQVALSGTSTQALPPGQQWSYRCWAEFVIPSVAGAAGHTFTPGGNGADALASTSGPNLVQGTFTTQ